MSEASQRFSAQEKACYEEQGFVVRTGVFETREIAAIVEECEALVERVIRNRESQRQRFGSYTFDADVENGVMIKWEGESDVVHGLEPFAHLSEPLNAWAHDPRFIEPMKDILGCDEPALFTEKLNLKRPHHGGVNPLHQDYPYWVRVAEDASEVATAMLFLDDADLENGCLHVVPGSHRRGQWDLSENEDRFARNELNESMLGELKSVPVEVTAGSLILFGPYLVHQSAPNLSDRERRALLYSYQPPGRTSQLEAFRRGYSSRQES
jgi:phytanoyl-CoA hydroxylase